MRFKFNKLNARNLKVQVHMHKPTIFTVVGIIGIGGSIYTAIKATPKALEVMAQAEAQKYNDISKDHTPTPDECKLTLLEKTKCIWKLYLPCAVSSTAAITCFISANSINTKRLATMTTAYQLSETAFKRYKDEVIQTIGEKKEQTIQSNVRQKELNDNPISQKEVIFTSRGDTLIYEPLSGRYFKSDADQVKRAIDQLNHNRLNAMDAVITLNDFFEAVQLAEIDLGEIFGWYLDDGLVCIDFDSKVAEDGKTPCLVIAYTSNPEPLIKY